MPRIKELHISKQQELKRHFLNFSDFKYDILKKKKIVCVIRERLASTWRLTIQDISFSIKIANRYSFDNWGKNPAFYRNLSWLSWFTEWRKSTKTRTQPIILLLNSLKRFNYFLFILSSMPHPLKLSYINFYFVVSTWIKLFRGTGSEKYTSPVTLIDSNCL